MFGLVVSGRFVQTDFQQINETQFLTTILDADNINHIVVFLTGAVSLPEGFGAQVFFSWPDPNSPPNWQCLGFISNQKPSAIFKIATLRKLHEMGDFHNMSTFGQQAICHNAQIGISIEPLVNMQDNRQDETNAYMTFAQKMLENFMNYVLSFSTDRNRMLGDPNTTYVPMSTIQTWYTNFERRLQQNPSFWKT